MVKTRHSGEGDIDSPPQLLSLANERQRRKVATDHRDQDHQDDGHDHDYNIFDEKVVDSRLRPRVGPNRAYNYLDADSSDDESYRRSRRHQTLRDMEPEHSMRHRRSRDIKQEMIDHSERRRSSRRMSQPCEDQHSVTEEEEEEEESLAVRRRSSRARRQVYDSLNQSYILSYTPQAGEDQHGRDRSRDNEHHSDEKTENADPNKFSDMYSRVKRKRIQIKRNMYGVPINDDSESDQEVTKRRNRNNSKRNDDEEDEDNDDDDDQEEDEENEDEKNNGNQSGTSKRFSLRKRQPQIVKSYSLREHKPRTVLYKAPVEEPRIRRTDHSIFPGTPTKKNPRQTYQSPAQRRHFRKRSAFHSSSSSTSSSSDGESSDEKKFKKRKSKSMAKARSRMMPMNFSGNAMPSCSVIKDRVKSGASLADVEPMNIDKNVTFNSIGGLGKHIRALKEMVVFPLLYDKVFQRFKVDPPRGVLFYGPPGTGKTLVARALANECSHGDRKVAFFMRKGADCLSKWVGESERQLRLLFDQAYKFRPSIIFFDEIDGLAPVRSSRQDQIHSSIVSTLLALMDGLDTRGEIVVIGATNRIDSLDPALRRPGRFDREFLFPLPSMEARKQILKIHTTSWTPKLNDNFLTELAEKCVGYCGADLKALCTEAAMYALRRRYPQIYISNEALQLDESSIQVSAKDFFDGVNTIIPTSQRAVNTPARALNSRVCPLLQGQLDKVMIQLEDSFPLSLGHTSSLDAAATSSQAQALAESGAIWDEMASDEDENAPSIFVTPSASKGSKAYRSLDLVPGSSRGSTPNYLNFTSYASSRPVTFRPRIMLVGQEGQGQTTHIAPAVVHKMESLPVHVLDLPALYAVTAKTPEESCANVFHEAKRKCPSIVYLPYISQWWDVMADTLRATLLTLIQDLDPSLPLLLLATSEQPYHTLDPVLQSLFSKSAGEVVTMSNPNKEERREFFSDLILRQACRPPPKKKQAGEIIALLEQSKRAMRFGHRKKRGMKFSQKKRARLVKTELMNEAKQRGLVCIKRRPVGRLRKNKIVEKPKVDPVQEIVLAQAEPPVKPKQKSITGRKLSAVAKCSPWHTHTMTLRPRSFLSKLNRNQSARHSVLACTPRDQYFVKPSSSSRCEDSPFLKPCLPHKMHHSHKHFHQAKARPSESSNCINIEYHHLSKRHLRYLRRYQGHFQRHNSPDTSTSHMFSTKSNKKYHQHQGSSPVASTSHMYSVKSQSSAMSCGSFLMLDSRDEAKPGRSVHAFSSALSLPINLMELHGNRSEACFPTLSSTSMRSRKGKSIKKPLCQMRVFTRHHRYNLRSRKARAQRMLEVLPKAGPSKPKELTKEELRQLQEKEELTLMELRIFLRDVLNKLGSDKKFAIFAKPVNIEDAPDYYEVIERPMDLSTMMAKIDLHEYNTVHAFMDDIDLVCSNALEYNPNRGAMDRVIRHRACALKDTAYAIIKTELDKDFEKMCMEIEESRKRRGEKSSSVPNFYYTRPKQPQQPVIPSYLDQPKPVRSIPQPEGERFSRRVRGMNIDPTPPLEAVEKVYKAVRSQPSPTRGDNSNNSNSKDQPSGSVECESKSLPSGKDGTEDSSDVKTSTPKVPSSSKLSNGNNSANTAGSSNKDSKKKRPKCVWCRPKRKRPRLMFSRPRKDSEVNEEDSENEVETSQDVEEEEEEVEKEENVGAASPAVHEPLKVDVQHNNSASKDIKSPPSSSGQPSRLRSPPTSPLGVTTRRSSMSPRGGHTNTTQPATGSVNVEVHSTEDQPNQASSATEVSESPSKSVPALAKSADPAVPIEEPMEVQPPTEEKADKPSVVKRLDLDSVLDSGVGSSLDSNGDSRDSSDHNSRPDAKLKPETTEKDTNQSCSSLDTNMKDRAKSILNETSKDLILDVPRLTSILHRLVANTEGFNVEHLEKIYSHLSMVIHRHRHNSDRTHMIEELERKTETLTKVPVNSASTSKAVRYH